MSNQVSRTVRCSGTASTPHFDLAGWTQRVRTTVHRTVFQGHLMTEIGRPCLSSVTRQQWYMSKAGDSLSLIARTDGSPACSMFAIRLAFGVILQVPSLLRSPARRVANWEEISGGIAGGESYLAIRWKFCRLVSAIGRELARDEAPTKYRAAAAAGRAWRQAKRRRPACLAQTPAPCAYPTAGMQGACSPEQGTTCLGTGIPTKLTCVRRMRRSTDRSLTHRAIVLARELRVLLHFEPLCRRSAHNTTTGQWRSQVNGAVSTRDPTVDSRRAHTSAA